jgi:hypothetical protein
MTFFHCWGSQISCNTWRFIVINIPALLSKRKPLKNYFIFNKTQDFKILILCCWSSFPSPRFEFEELKEIKFENFNQIMFVIELISVDLIYLWYSLLEAVVISPYEFIIFITSQLRCWWRWSGIFSVIGNNFTWQNHLGLMLQPALFSYPSQSFVCWQQCIPKVASFFSSDHSGFQVSRRNPKIWFHFGYFLRVKVHH